MPATTRFGFYLLLALGLHPAGAATQVLADPILSGRVTVGDSGVGAGVVVLHEVSSLIQGEIDSVAVGPDGSFSLRLPRVPDEAIGDMFFASTRHDGVMYFGNAITRPVDLDSLYLIHAFDTLVAPAEGAAIRLAARSMFFEPNGNQWAIMDAFQLGNDGDRTIIPQAGGRVWSYPLPTGARDMESDETPDIVGYSDGQLVFTGPLPPGGRLVIVRYFVDSLAVALPTPGETDTIQLLVREPAPSIAVEGLVRDESIMTEDGTTYRAFGAGNVTVPQIRVVMAAESAPPPVEWIAVVLALILAAGGLLAWRGGPRPAAAGPQDSRQAVLVELARLDEAFENESSPSASRTSEYRRRRAELMGRLSPKA